jgi:hypothetical protein
MMANKEGLFLHEEITLLALRDDKGTFLQSERYPMAVGGAILAELLLRKRVKIEDEKKKLIRIANIKPVGDPVVDECLKKVREAKRRASIKTWVGRFRSVKNLKHRVAQRLCRRGILREDEEKILRIFTRRIYPEIDPKPEREIIERLRKAIFSNDREVDPRTTVLVSLAHTAHLLEKTFGKKEVKARKERIKKITQGEMIGRAAKEVMEAMAAAVAITVIMPAVYSSANN